MKTRILSGIAMVPLLIFVYLGGYYLMAVSFIIGAMAVKEFHNGFKEKGVNVDLAICNVALVFLYSLATVNQAAMGIELNKVLGILAFAVIGSSLKMLNIKKTKIEDTMVTVIAVMYIVFFSFHIVLVNQLPGFENFTWLILITAFGSDIFAYFSGYFFGKHKLCPDLSPKKTIEGAIGGVLGTGLCTWAFMYFVEPQYMFHGLFIGIIASVLSMCGDLTASAYKRHLGIKDYGNLIPGHGGVLDRIDSVLFTAPVIYYYIVVVLV